MKNMTRHFFIMGVFVAFGIAASCFVNASDNSKFTKSDCETAGGSYSSGSNYSRCEYSNGDSYTCNSDVNQCETCTGGKCTVSLVKGTGGSGDMGDVLIDGGNTTTPGKYQLAGDGTLPTNTPTAKSSARELVEIGDLRLDVADSAPNVQVGVVSYRLLADDNKFLITVKLANGDFGAISFLAIDKELPQHRFRDRADGTRAYAVYLHVDKLDSTVNMLKNFSNIEFYYHLSSNNWFIWTGNDVAPGTVN